MNSFLSPFLIANTLNDWLSEQLGEMNTLIPLPGLSLSQILVLLFLVGFGLLLGYIGEWLLRFFTRMPSEGGREEWLESVLELLPKPLRLAVALLVFRIGSDQIGLAGVGSEWLTLIVQTLLIVVLVWCFLRVLSVASTFLESYLIEDADDPIKRRAIHTQIAVPRGIIRVLAIFIGIALILLQFEVVRSIGVSLLASAGVAGIVIGFAARSTVENLLAGVQVAVFQPIKIGDVVIAEGEWGTIEDITLTYVVVKIWDERRLILPVTYFLQKPIENWTRKSAQLLGTVYLYTDYTVSVEAARAELDRIVQGSELWDKRANGLIVTSLTPETVELRALVSAKDSSDIWNLRCLVREKLLAWLQAEGVKVLPTRRIEMHSERDVAAA